MSGECDGLIVSGIKKKEEIQLADQKASWESGASRSQENVVVGVIDAKDKQLLDEMEAVKINILDIKEEHQNNTNGKIQQVPKIMLRNANLKEYFKPRELSIGPIHAANPNLFKKELKLKLAAYFVGTRGKTGAGLLQEIKSEIKDIKEFFEEEITKTYTCDDLFRLVFLDGCAMLGFMQCYMKQQLDVFNISNDQATLIQQDLLLLENQIPLKVLLVLLPSEENMTMTADHFGDEYLIFKFISVSSIITKDYLEKPTFQAYSHSVYRSSAKPVDHILGLYRRMLLSSAHYSPHKFKKLLDFIYSCFSHNSMLALEGLISYGIERLLYGRRAFPQYWNNMMQSSRNVHELKTAGIKIKPSDSLADISFHSRFFTTYELKLPTLVVNDLTLRVLLNLVAYEMCLPNNQTTDYDHDDLDNYWVTSYINLLDFLIDNEQDVKDLRAADILQNSLGSDIEAANMINGIGSYCFAPPKDTYEHVKCDIENHCRSSFAIWRAQVSQSDFGSPWAVLSVFAAVILLVLAAIQTWYAIMR